MGCGCGKSREQRAAERQAKQERLAAMQEERAARQPEDRPGRRALAVPPQTAG